MDDDIPLYVTDTSVFMDAYALGLLDGIFGIGKIITSDLVFEECRKNPECFEQLQTRRDVGLLEVKALDATQISLIYGIVDEEPGLSPQDCSVYILAKSQTGILLTGDGALRKCGLSGLTEVHGLLFCIVKLVHMGWYDHVAGCKQLRAWKNLNRMAPKTLIANQVADWEASR